MCYRLRKLEFLQMHDATDASLEKLLKAYFR
jgi:hypothetical protein